jgi:hypothetical protein
MSNLYSYIMRDDTGFAPHFDERCLYLSLACCKPQIRKTATENDWLVGFGGRELSKKSGRDMKGRLIYAAKISQILDFDSYYSSPTLRARLDNIYFSVNQKGEE